jgi:hypothetical protein
MCRQTAVLMPFSIHAMASTDDHRDFVVGDFIQNGGSPIMTQHSQQTKFPVLVSH